MVIRLLGLALGLAVVALGNQSASAQNPTGPDPYLPRMFYYPYYYFPHNYWPANSPRWPERPGQPYMKPPAYMAWPPYQAMHWRYEALTPQKYHSGFHFWLDQF